MKTLVRITTAVALFFAMTSVSFAEIKTGKAGDRTNYRFDTETGILTIYGTGSTYNRNGSWNYGYSNRSPIYDYRNQIKTVVIEEGVTTIGAAFFYQCSKITSITMPASVTTIYEEAFRGCSSLETLEVGPGVTSIHDRWTTDCTKLSYISVAEGNPSYVSVGGVIYTYDLHTLVRFPEALNTRNYEIPEGTVDAATDALYKLHYVEAITIPSTMTSIKYGSFDTCDKLTQLVLHGSTPPVLEKKDLVNTHLTSIFVPCGNEATYTNNGSWGNYGGNNANISGAVVVQFHVATNNPEWGDVSITSRADCEGYDMTIKAIPTSLGVFSHWEDGPTTPERTIHIDENNLDKEYSYKAIFTAMPYDITLKKGTAKIDNTNVLDLYQVEATKESTGEHATTTESNTTVTHTFHYGDTLQVFCNVKQGVGRKFKQWSDGDKNNPRTVVVTGAKTYTAQIENGSVTVNSSTNNTNQITYGSVTPTTKTVGFGESVTFTASPAESGYQFLYWLDDTENKNPVRTITATADVTYKAIFGPKTYKITVVPNDAEMGICTGTATVDYNSNVTFTATPKTGYRFLKWQEDNDTHTSRTIRVKSDITYTALFEPLKYTISFKGENGADLVTPITADYNTTPVYPGETPTKDATDKYTYTFNGWNPPIAKVTGDATYTVQFTSTINKYTISFVNYDDSPLQTSEVEYDAKPLYNGATPTRPGTEKYTYSYKGWDKTIVPVTGNTTYKATYNETINKYAIKFVNYDGSVLQNTDVEYDATPVYSDAIPTKPQDDEWTYSFDGWSPTIATVTGTATYTATFNKTKRQYVIRFVDEGGNELKKYTLDYGSEVDYDGSDPTKESTDEWNYTFAGWTPNIANVTGAATYTATFTPSKRKHTITFVNYNGEVLQATDVEYGTKPAYNGTTPTKPTDGANNYTFIKWSPDIVNVEGPATYTAQFSSATRFYTIRFLDYDDVVIESIQYEYNQTPSHAAPTRQSDTQYDYTFTGWTPDITDVTEDKDYKATYSQTLRKYTIKFFDGNNALLQESDWNFGTTPAYNGTTPTKNATAKYSYTFNDTWSPAITNVAGNANYTAQFDETINKYRIEFVNYDNTVLQSSAVEYDDTPVYTESTPSRDADAQYTYTFDGWDKTIAKVTGNATYKAVYTSTPIPYTITFKNADGTTLDERTYYYNETPSYAGTPVLAPTAQYTYSFKGWDKPIAAVTKNETYTAQYNATVNHYTIHFINEDGTSLKDLSFEYGETPEYNGETPLKASTEQYNFIHNGWTPAIADVTGEATYTATYKNIVRSYKVQFKNYDGSVLFETDVDYNNYAHYPLESPTRPNTAQYKYSYIGWDKSLSTTAIKGETTFTAVYHEDLQSYDIVFVNYDGTELKSYNLVYDALPAYVDDEGSELSNPTRPSDNEHVYTFTKWSPDIAKVTGPATYTAQFSTATHFYTIRFFDYDGNLIASQQYEYNETPSHTAPTRAADAEYTYTFTNWEPAIENVTKDQDYTAQYSQTKNKYDITFVDGNGQSTIYQVEFGTIPEYTGETPEKTSTDEFDYTFNGQWQPEIVVVTGNATYTAQFDETRRKYLIEFVDFDNSALWSGDVEYGVKPQCNTPQRDADVQYIYTFSNWTPEVVNVAGPAKYKAVYSTTLQQYTIAVNCDASQGSTIGSGTYEYGRTVEISTSPNHGFKFVNWNDNNTLNPRNVNVTGNASYTATLEREKYTLTVVSADNSKGTTSGSGTYDFETNVEIHAIANNTGYEFVQWNDNNTQSTRTISVTDNATYTAQFRNKSFNLTWNTDGGTVLTGDYTHGLVEFEAEITQPNAPQKTGFTFNGWLPNLTTMPASDIECVAQWTENGDTPYKVEHWLQNIDNDEYTEFESEDKTGKTNVTTNVAPKNYTGFTAEPDKIVNCNIEADGSGVAKIYYKRNIHTLRWIVDGVEVTENCTNGDVRFGAEINAPADPEKEGYTFAGWNSTIAATMPDENVTYTATWTPNSNTAYTVLHYKQNIDGSYAAMADETDNLTGTTAALTAAQAREYEGFAHQTFEQAPIAADGSTIISIQYTRNRHILDWYFGICTIGEEPYTNSNDDIAFGTPIVAPTLVKNGYTLTWNTEIPATMPDHDLSLTAIWTANNVEYTVNHWLQTVDGLLYSIDATDTLIGLTDAETEAETKEYAGFTAQDFNQANIEADSSTIINIYYQRNTHQLTWNIGEGQIANETEYTAAGTIMFGAPITAPVLARDGFTYVWNNEIPTTMPDSSFTATAIWTASNQPTAPYLVSHNLQGLDGSFAIAVTDTMSGIVDSLTAAVAKTFEGFTAEAFEQDSIAANSSTVVNINYSRNKHTLTWNIGESQIENETEYTADSTVLFGAPIIAPVLVREGFTYVWNTEIPATMPDSAFTATAVWTADNVTEPKQATYLVLHNQQALDNSFVIAAVDTLVGFADSLTVAVAKTFEGFTAEAFEQDSIAADSSTIVNINYARNKYTLTWNLEGDTPINDNYTKAGQVAFGTPIVAPQFMEKDYTSYSWDTLPETMPADNLTCKLIIMVEDSEIPERISFTVPATFVTCDDRHIEATNIIESNTKFTWSVNGVVDESQTGASFDIPEDAAPTGTITVTGYIGDSSWTEEIQYTVKRRIITTMWDDVITVDNTTGNYESYNWYHNGELVSDKAYYQEIGGLTGNYYLTAVTIDGVEINSCEETFEEPQTTAITAYPNPTTDKVIVKSGKMNAGDRLIVTDSNGKIWKTETVSNPAGEVFDLSNLPQGSYTISAGGESINIIKL
ncbi:MAG: leucine-rich repeat protein [Salinivirgaceae bacterium]|nr:leucine-rich repeat protein [Salinivirgaceae bacterium]